MIFLKRHRYFILHNSYVSYTFIIQDYIAKLRSSSDIVKQTKKRLSYPKSQWTDQKLVGHHTQMTYVFNSKEQFRQIQKRSRHFIRALRTHSTWSVNLHQLVRYKYNKIDTVGSSQRRILEIQSERLYSFWNSKSLNSENGTSSNASRASSLLWITYCTNVIDFDVHVRNWLSACRVFQVEQFGFPSV